MSQRRNGLKVPVKVSIGVFARRRPIVWVLGN
jgi:hypothetical protein